MSPRRPASSVVGPPPDRETIMGPPATPLPSSTQQPAKDNQDVSEKYRKLKRRYFELEEKLKGTQNELKLSGERNVRLRDEREMILQRVHELEARSEPNAPGGSWPSSSAFPRSLLLERSRIAFVNNLRQAMAEEEAEDHCLDPLLPSRHLGSLSRKRTDDEFRVDDEAGDARRQTKRSRGPPKARDVPGHHPTPPTSQPPINLTPTPQRGGGDAGVQPLLVSHKGTKLRLKPPVPPSELEGGQLSGARPPSPLSPIVSPRDEYSTPHAVTSYDVNGGIGLHSPHPPSNVNSASAPAPSPFAATGSSVMSAQPSEVQRHAKPKRLKAHTVTSKNYSIPMVPRDKKGRPQLPLTVGIMTVMSLGEVCMREHFHTERYIFPVGYEVTRRYASTIDPNADATYKCTILDGGDGPKFQIEPSDLPGQPIIAGTATGAWANIVKQANIIRNRQHSNSVSGPDFFGLGQNTIKHLIQELPGADRLRDYVWQNFVEGGR